MELYYISLHAIEQHTRNQFGEPDDRQRRDRPETAPERPSRIIRLRLWLSAGLNEIATALDPTPGPAPKTQS
jgi:hypothetical protein